MVLLDSDKLVNWNYVSNHSGWPAHPKFSGSGQDTWTILGWRVVFGSTSYLLFPSLEPTHQLISDLIAIPSESFELTTKLYLSHIQYTLIVFLHTIHVCFLYVWHTHRHIHMDRLSYRQCTYLDTTSELFHYFLSLSLSHTHFSFSPNTQINAILLKI